MLETKRLIIRKLTMEDSSFVLAILNADFANEYNCASKINEAILWKMIEYGLSYVLVLKENGTIIGHIGLEKDYLRYNIKSVSITYVLDEKYTHMGYMSEAIKEVLYDSFTRLERRIVSLRIASDNIPSINLAKRVGFHYDGMIRKGTRKEDGTIYDDLLFSMTKEEFESNLDI